MFALHREWLYAAGRGGLIALLLYLVAVAWWLAPRWRRWYLALAWLALAGFGVVIGWSFLRLWQLSGPSEAALGDRIQWAVAGGLGVIGSIIVLLRRGRRKRERGRGRHRK